ncbi:MAG TPA: metallophosphoesterase [Burkholderiaceae bacterium]|nr:metallophosphoesterase [Burkholderiaceae bacterium]
MPASQAFPRRGLIFAATLAIIAFCGGLYGCLAMRGTSIEPFQNTNGITVPGKGITIFAAGDIAECKNIKPENSGAAKTADMIAAGLDRDKRAAVLGLGDYAYPVGLLEEFADCYEPAWGRFRNRTFPAPGNHEYYTPSATGYYTYFGPAAGPDRRGYYSFNLGAWHLVSLNSNLQPADHQQQILWLQADLARHPAHCTLAFWHHPLYSSGGHGNNDRVKDLWQALSAAGADVVLVAHDHDYERFAPQDNTGRRDDIHGMREFVVGTGGARLTPLMFGKANSEVKNNSTHGVLRMVLKDTGYEWEFMPVPGGNFTDRGAALCH